MKKISYILSIMSLFIANIGLAQYGHDGHTTSSGGGVATGGTYTNTCVVDEAICNDQTQGNTYTIGAGILNTKTTPPQYNLDLAVNQITSPGTFIEQDTAAQIKVSITNYGSQTIDFSVVPVTLTVNIEGASTYFFSTNINSGSLITGASQEVTVSQNVNLTALGNHHLTAFVVMNNDESNTNDTLSDIITVTPSLAPTSFAGNMTLTGELLIDNISSRDLNDVLYAFSGNDLRGVALPTYIAGLDKYIYFLTIYGSTDGDILDLKAYDNSENKLLSISESYTFITNDFKGSPAFPEQLNAAGLMTQIIPCNSNWTWVGANIIFPNSDINEVLSSLTPSNGDVVKTQSSFATYYNGSWIGSLTSIDKREMFMLKLTHADSLELEGSAIDFSAPHPIPSGWYWTVVPSTQGDISVSGAYSSTDPTDGDLVKTQTSGFSQFHAASSSWIGSLSMLSMGMGIMSYFTTPDSQAVRLVAPNTPIALQSNNPPPPPPPSLPANWVVNPSSYSNNTSIIAQVAINGVLDTNLNSVISAWDNTGQCRAVNNIQYIPALNQYMFFITAYGDNYGDTLDFKLYRGSDSTIIDLNETIVFDPTGVVGNAGNPFPFTGTISVVNCITPTLNIVGDSTFCANNPSTLYADVLPNKTYQWLRNGLPISSTDTLLVPTQSGSYTYESSDQNCVDTSNSINITIQDITNIIDISGNFNLTSSASETYTVVADTSAIFLWTVTGGSFITNDSTNQVTVNWSANGGNICVKKVTTLGCTSNEICKNVGVLVNPTNLTVTTFGQNHLQINWFYSSNSSILGFELERSDSINGTFITVAYLSPTDTLFDDYAVFSNKEYCYRVKVLGANNQFAYSNIACGTTCPTAPTSPLNVSVVANSPSSVTISWSLGSNNSANKIVIKQHTNGNNVSLDTVSSDSSSYTLYNLMPNQSYCLVLQAITDCDISLHTLPYCVITPALSLPILNAVATPQSEKLIYVTWDNPATYIIRNISNTLDTIILNGNNVINYTDNNLQPNTTVDYIIYNNSGDSAIATATTPANCGYSMTHVDISCGINTIEFPIILHQTTDSLLGYVIDLDFPMGYVLSSTPMLFAPSFIASTHAEVNINYTSSTSVRLAINLKFGAPVGTYFNGVGGDTVMTLVLSKSPSYSPVNDSINITHFEESFQGFTNYRCVDNGTVTQDVNPNAPLSLTVNNGEAFGFDANISGQLHTQIYNVQNTNDPLPTSSYIVDTLGQLEISNPVGDTVKLIRDIDSTTMVMAYIGGNDAYLLRYFILHNGMLPGNVIPTIEQLIKMDVDGSGNISAADLSLLIQRYLFMNGLNEFPYGDWYFIDSTHLNNMEISSNYPNCADGFCPSNIPKVHEYQNYVELNVDSTSLCKQYLNTPIIGLMIGDINGTYKMTSTTLTNLLHKGSQSLILNLDSAEWISNNTLEIAIHWTDTTVDINSLDVLLNYQPSISFDSFSVDIPLDANFYNVIGDSMMLFTSYDIIPYQNTHLNKSFAKLRITTNDIRVDMYDFDANSIAYFNGEPTPVIFQGFTERPSSSHKIEQYKSSISPNPAKDWIRVTSAKEVSQIIFHAIDGKLLKTMTVNAYQKEIDITDLPNGSIAVTLVFSDGYQVTKQVIKQ